MEPVRPLLFAHGAAFEAWLAQSHAVSSGEWLQLGKKGGRIEALTYPAALDVALCWGWIDSQKRSWDQDTFLQRFTPRKADSPWSRINRDRVEALMAEGRMREPGLAAVGRARETGRWDRAYEGAATIQVPDDFRELLRGEPEAAAFFASLDPANRYAYLFRLANLAPGSRRAAGLARYLDQLKAGRRYH